MTYFLILGPPPYFWNGAARDFIFGVRIHRLACKPKNAKVGQKVGGPRHVTYFYNFGAPYISRTDKVRNFKFGVRIDRRA